MVGILSIDIDNDIFEFERNNAYSGILPMFLNHPKSLMPMNLMIKTWVLNRAPEPNYEFIDVLIKKVGLKSYDAYGFFKYNKGKFILDKFYVEEITNG